MADTEPVYEKTRFRHRGSGISSQLWKASDHLLLVSRTGATERYYRLFLTEIQGLQINHSPRGIWINIVGSLVSAMLLLIGLGMLSDGETEGFFVFLSMALPCLVVVIINLIKGTTVDCYIRTQSGLTRMGVVTRFRKADALMAAFHEWLDPVQGDLPEDADVRYLALAPGWSPPKPAAEPVAPAAPVAPAEFVEAPPLTDPVEPVDPPSPVEPS